MSITTAFAAGLIAGIVWSALAIVIAFVIAATIAEKELSDCHDDPGTTGTAVTASGIGRSSSPLAERNGTLG